MKAMREGIAIGLADRATSEDAWISVEDRLPTELGETLIYDGKRDFVCVDTFISEDGFWEDTEPTHWMPLPPPPARKETPT